VEKLLIFVKNCVEIVEKLWNIMVNLLITCGELLEYCGKLIFLRDGENFLHFDRKTNIGKYNLPLQLKFFLH
jgi:hypothetical protein